MKTAFALSVGSFLLFAPMIPTLSLAQSGQTCQSALDGSDFSDGAAPQDSDCCYVEPELAWYAQNNVWHNRFYQRNNNATVVFTRTCGSGGAGRVPALLQPVEARSAAGAASPPLVRAVRAEGKGFDTAPGHSKTPKSESDNGKGNGIDPAPGGSGDKRGDDADGANTPGTIDTSGKR